ncbi:MAG TPA: TIGR04372 family glycosyltransferase [Bradyrhizobium sp.]|uniref:TIGR04372 family glycosyltransferase n=1 Tax=Bradyrhizobium sp. TaxID=376 RepID=UPI002C9F9188|nr:TIGR04372 family glycosyltransferase [Bradyrhizobium sp.]HLZ03221.1 TIGR04372 family glycosyltransferase [Bradyrhizobium sp.]
MKNGHTKSATKSVPWLQRRRLIHHCFICAGAALDVLPRRLVFWLLVVCEKVRFPGRRRLALAYQPYAVAFLTDHPTWRFSEKLKRWLPEARVQVLFGIGAYREAAAAAFDEMASVEGAITVARARFELGLFREARDIASACASRVELQKVPDLAYLKAMLDIIDGDETAALASLSRAYRGKLRFLRPHQNLASRPGSDYVPNHLDFLCDAPGRLFDLCNFTGERTTHVGRGDIGVRLYARALAAQAQLRSLSRPGLSVELAQLLDELEIPFDELRIIPEEWTTQIGHLGMLDILFRMRELGWWSGRPLIVTRPGRIANQAFFRLFKRFSNVLVIGENVSDLVAEELLSLQRWCGMNFNAFHMPNGEVMAWQEAGALAIAQWEREGRGHPLRDEYDRVYGSSAEAAGKMQRFRENFGMKPDDWYVCLHTRDASHYFELAGTGQTHRNSPVESYLDAIRSITERGGWVIKLGGQNSPKLPELERTIDYALSDFRSELMDIGLIRNANAFIGTTSGLTNVAISFGIPSAIVNCITTDAQLWNSNVRFALKPVRLADGKMLTQAQSTSAPWRWRLFDAAVLGRSGAHPGTNTPDEITEVVREVDALARGQSSEFEREVDAGGLLSRWKEQLALPHYYGTSRPSLYYLRKYESEFLTDADDRAAESDGPRRCVVNG